MADPDTAAGGGSTGVWEPGRARTGLVLAAVLWSLAGVFIKFLPLDPLTIVFYRSLFAALFFALFLKVGGAYSPGKPLLVAAGSYTAAITSFVAANKLTSAANAIVLQYTAPIFVFLIVRFLYRQTIESGNWLALCLGMIGIGVIFLGSVGQPDAPGVGVALLSGVLFSVYMVSLRHLTHVRPATLTFLTNAACCVLLLPALWSKLSIGADHALVLAVMGVVQLGIPYWLFSKAVAAVPVQEASLIVLIEPVLNPTWVALAVGEVPEATTVAGGVLIVAAVAFRCLVQGRATQKPEPSLPD